MFYCSCLSLLGLVEYGHHASSWFGAVWCIASPEFLELRRVCEKVQCCGGMLLNCPVQPLQHERGSEDGSFLDEQRPTGAVQTPAA